MNNLVSRLILYFLRIILVAILVFYLNSCSSADRYSQYTDLKGKLIEKGIASWYGPNFHGKLTANGEIYNMYELTAAHKTLPFNSMVRVLNLSNGNSVIVRINDRGPFVKNRIIDLSKKAAQEIDMIQSGYTEVELTLLSNPEELSKNKGNLFTIQIGSFKNKSDADDFSSKFEESKVVKAKVDDSTFYRVYYGEYNNEDIAESEKNILMKRGIECFVKKLD